MAALRLNTNVARHDFEAITPTQNKPGTHDTYAYSLFEPFDPVHQVRRTQMDSSQGVAQESMDSGSYSYGGYNQAPVDAAFAALAAPTHPQQAVSGSFAYAGYDAPSHTQTICNGPSTFDIAAAAAVSHHTSLPDVYCQGVVDPSAYTIYSGFDEPSQVQQPPSAYASQPAYGHLPIYQAIPQLGAVAPQFDDDDIFGSTLPMSLPCLPKMTSHDMFAQNSCLSSVPSAASSPEYHDYSSDESNATGKSRLSRNSSIASAISSTGSGGGGGGKIRSGRRTRTGSMGSDKDREKKFVCSYPGCARSFTRNFNLSTHYNTHLGIKPFPCPNCPKSFSRRHDCARHVAAVHTGASASANSAGEAGSNKSSTFALTTTSSRVPSSCSCSCECVEHHPANANVKARGQMGSAGTAKYALSLDDTVIHKIKMEG